MSSRLAVFSNDVDWVVANDLDDAWAVWTEHTGERRSDYDDAEEAVLTEQPDESKLTIWCNADGKPDEPQLKENTRVTLTMAQWAEKQGRGFLCSTEY